MNKIVRGWDDPRMPTLRGFRRRGYLPQSINKLCDTVSITRSTTINTDISLLESICRNDLDLICNRCMMVYNPIKLIIDNYDEDKV